MTVPPPLSKPGRDEPLAHRPKPLPPCEAVETLRNAAGDVGNDAIPSAESLRIATVSMVFIERLRTALARVGKGGGVIESKLERK